MSYCTPNTTQKARKPHKCTNCGEAIDIGKPVVKRLTHLGVLQSHGFGKYSITAFGHFALEHTFAQKPSLPLMTNDDRDHAVIAKVGGAV